jgi:Flp pilus assembly secretin CpaC
MDKRLVAFLILAMSVAQGQTPGSTGKLTVTVGKSLIIDSPLNIHWVSVANGELIEAVAVNSREIIINGKSPGETSLVVEQENGNRLLYDLTIRPGSAAFQIQLKVRFASVAWNALADLGLNLT